MKNDLIDDVLYKDIEDNITLMLELRYYDNIKNFISLVRERNNKDIPKEALDAFPAKLLSHVPIKRLSEYRETLRKLITSYLIFDEGKRHFSKTEIESLMNIVDRAIGFYSDSILFTYQENDREYLLRGKYKTVTVNNKNCLLWLLVLIVDGEKRYIHVITDIKKTHYIRHTPISHIFSFLPDNLTGNGIFKENIIANLLDTEKYPLGKADYDIAHSFHSGLGGTYAKPEVMKCINFGLDKIFPKENNIVGCDNNTPIAIHDVIRNYSTWKNLPEELLPLANLIRKEHQAEIIRKIKDKK